MKTKAILILGDEDNRAELIADMNEIEAEKLGVPVDVQRSADPALIEEMKVMRTPAIAVDGAVRLVLDQNVDKLPDAAIIRRWLMG